MPLKDHEDTLAKHGEEIAGLKAITKTTSENVASLAESVRQMGLQQAQEHNATRKEIGMLGERMGQYGKPNWALVLAGSVFIMALGAAILGPLQLQVSEGKFSREKLADELAAHINLPVHPVAAAIIEEREKARLAEQSLRDQIQDLRFEQVNKCLAAPRELFEQQIKSLHNKTP